MRASLGACRGFGDSGETSRMSFEIGLKRIIGILRGRNQKYQNSRCL